MTWGSMFELLMLRFQSVTHLCGLLNWAVPVCKKGKVSWHSVTRALHIFYPFCITYRLYLKHNAVDHKTLLLTRAGKTREQKLIKITQRLVPPQGRAEPVHHRERRVRRREDGIGEVRHEVLRHRQRHHQRGQRGAEGAGIQPHHGGVTLVALLKPGSDRSTMLSALQLWLTDRRIQPPDWSTRIWFWNNIFPHCLRQCFVKTKHL